MRDQSHQPLLNVSNVSQRFGGLEALVDVNVDVSRAEIVGLVGPNGAGKSTLFNIIAGLARPVAGSIMLDGQSVNLKPPHEFVHMGIAKTFQSSRLFEDLSVLENVAVGALVRHSKDGALKVAQQVLERIGAAHLADRYPKEINISEKVLVEISRVLATGPKVLLLDEVMAPLDRKETDRLIELLKGLKQDGLAILMIEHHMPPLLRLIDRIFVLNFGKIIADGDPLRALRSREVVEAYLGPNVKV